MQDCISLRFPCTGAMGVSWNHEWTIGGNVHTLLALQCIQTLNLCTCTCIYLRVSKCLRTGVGHWLKLLCDTLHTSFSACLIITAPTVGYGNKSWMQESHLITCKWQEEQSALKVTSEKQIRAQQLNVQVTFLKHPYLLMTTSVPKHPNHSTVTVSAELKEAQPE